MAASHGCWTPVISHPRRPRRFDSDTGGREGLHAERRIGAIDAAPDSDAAAGEGRDRSADGDHLVQAAAPRIRCHQADPPARSVQDARLARAARSAARRGQARGEARAEAALSRVLQGRHRDRRRRHPAGAPRQGCVRQDLRPSAGDRPCRRNRSIAHRPSRRWSAPTGCCARTPRSSWRLLQRERVRCRRSDRAAFRACVSSSSAGPACCRPTATSAPSNCSGTASGPTSAAPLRRHDRLRQPRRHRSGPAGVAAVVPASLRGAPWTLARRRPCRRAASR